MNIVTTPNDLTKLEALDRSGDKITVLNPMGYPPKITRKTAAPRLESLNGKTIYLVDCRFDDSIELLKQVQAWFAAHMPEVTTRIVSLSATYQHDDPKTWEEIKAKGDAAIVGVGHCSNCSPAVATHAITLETKYGVPTVALHTDKFDQVVQSVTKMAELAAGGARSCRSRSWARPPTSSRPMSTARIRFPGARSCRKSSRRSRWRSTTPMRACDVSLFDTTTPRLVAPDTEENLQRLFLENDWTDKLPYVLTTVKRVAAMLAHTSRAAADIVGHMQPVKFRMAWEYTVEQVAVNAVMAGAEPEYFPVILALAASQVSARGSTSSSASAMVVVNGPIRHEIGMNAGIGAMGPYNHANATIGRAYGLLSQNLQGGSVPGVSFMGSQGNGYTYNNLTFAENEERSPFEPLHVQKGFKPTDSTVSIFYGCRSTTFCLGLRAKYWREHVRDMLLGIDGHSSPCLLLDPITARQFIDRGGFDTKEKLIRFVHETGEMPAGRYWDLQLVQNYVYPLATFGQEPMATWLKAAPDELIRIFPEEDINVVVVGGEANGYWRIMGCKYRKTVSIDDWR